MMRSAYIPPDNMEDVQPLLIGTGIPDVTLIDVEGQPVSLVSIVSQKPTILVFYRGNW